MELVGDNHGGTMSISATDTLSIESSAGAALVDVNLENAGNVQVDSNCRR